MRDSKIVSLSLVKKIRRPVLLWSAMNRMHALALARGSYSEYRSEKFSQEILHIIFAFLVFGGCNVRFSPVITFPAKEKRFNESLCILGLPCPVVTEQTVLLISVFLLRITESDNRISA
jgi:hypothetical protein